jgi:hypothetical protein
MKDMTIIWILSTIGACLGVLAWKLLKAKGKK